MTLPPTPWRAAEADGSSRLLTVSGLVVRFRTHDETVHAVNEVDLELLEGERLGVVGESGSGKTVSNLAVIRLLPRPAGRVEGGTIEFDGRDLLQLDRAEIQDLRGKDIAMVFQDPMTSLNPVLTIEEQLVETIRAHKAVTPRAARESAVELLTKVGIPQASERLKNYPHEFSGGMRQRVMIAMALALEPRLLIADEPTTALDVTIQAQVLDLLKSLTDSERTSLILITHDLGVVAGMTDRVNVMYAGEVVETATTADLFEHPAHPYTVGLLHSMPHTDPGAPLVPIEGAPPDLKDEPQGCPFAPRCAWRIERCWSDRPELAPLVPLPSGHVVLAGPGATHRIACHNPPTPDEAALGHPAPRRTTPDRAASRVEATAVPPADVTAGRMTVAPLPPESAAPARLVGDEILRVTDLKVYFPIRAGLLVERHVGDVRAVDGVSFLLRKGETLGLVGESGCGKTTTGRAVVRLLEPSQGRIEFAGRDISHIPEGGLMAEHRRMQMIFQDPYSSLDPRMNIEAIIAEPLTVNHIGTRRERRERVHELLDRVGLDRAFADRYPHEFSGGQRQRIGVARALAPSPDLIVADEPVSALDVSIQAQIVNLLDRLQAELGLAYLFIAHDLSVVEHLSHRTAVMYVGRFVEVAPSQELRARPLHPYSIALWSAIPKPSPMLEARRRRIILQGDIPSPANPPSGCRFHPRCWLRQQLGNPEICAELEPPLIEHDAGHAVACHFADRVQDSTEQRQVASASQASAPLVAGVARPARGHGDLAG
jgi:peptide/nickel transport system ATP-binding protein